MSGCRTLPNRDPVPDLWGSDSPRRPVLVWDHGGVVSILRRDKDDYQMRDVRYVVLVKDSKEGVE